MSTESIQPARSAWTRTVLIIVLLVFLGWTWSSARSAFSVSARMHRSSLTRPPVSDARVPTDIRQPASSENQRAPNPSRLIDALQNQIANSPALQDDDTQNSLLDSLQQAGDVLTRTRKQNQQALQQLQRQPRIGESRQAPNLVLITLDYANSSTDSDAQRSDWFQSLASQGVSFTQHYTGGATLDSAWWSLMTGKAPPRSAQGAHEPQLRESDVSLATSLWKAGYETAFFGIWPGTVAPRRCGFEEWTGLEGTDPERTLYPARLTTARQPMTIAANAKGQHGVSFWKLLDAEIASFLSSHAKATRPWLLQVHLSKFPDTTSPESAEGVVDQLLASLAANSLTESTCVFVTALSGPASAQPLSEVALRVPLIMIGGHSDNLGRKVSSVTAAYDLLPTLLDIARASRRPRELVGQSLVQQASRKAWNDQRAFTWTSNDSPGCVAIRQGEWFATRDRVDGPFRLYQSTIDPECEKDVAETHPEVVKRLQDLAAETPAADVSRASR